MMPGTLGTLTMGEPAPLPTTAVVKIRPDLDAEVLPIKEATDRLHSLAIERRITSNSDLAPVTEDSALIKRLLKDVEDRRLTYSKPLNDFLTVVNAYFRSLSGPLEAADKLNRDKTRAFLAEVERQRREAEAIEEAKLALARREAELKGGEITVDLTPVPMPEATPAHVRTAMGTMGTRTEPKWELEDLAKVPTEYLMLDTVKVRRCVRAGVRQIPGIRIWEEQNITIRS